MVDVEKIKSLCKERKTSLYALEKKLGLGNGTIGKWGKPNRKPNFDNVLAVANELGVPIQEIAENIKNPGSEPGAEILEEYIRLFKSLSLEDQKREIAYLRERAAEKDK